MSSSTEILERFRAGYGKDIDLTLRPAYHDLLAKFDNPHLRLPPVFHVAGTNGKGSTCAFLRAMLESAGLRVHVYTSPHLVTFHERIRVAGQLIGEEELSAILTEAENLATPHGVSYFEAATIAAFVAFSRHPADYTILETGLGGRLDATNIVPQPRATIITRLSYDHREYLGDTLGQIATEKAGIMRRGVPCYVMAQPEAEALNALRQAATERGANLHSEGLDWQVEERGNGFHFHDATRDFELPMPALLGQHQIHNAGLAIAALGSVSLTATAIAQGLRRVEWPARLQRLTTGDLAALLPEGGELWLDGGHNDSAGEVLAAQIKRWSEEDGDRPRPLYVILGMLTTKRPQEFIGPFATAITALRAVPVPDEALSFTAAALAAQLQQVQSVEPSANVAAALASMSTMQASPPPRVLICGSLYLAGNVLRENAAG